MLQKADAGHDHDENFHSLDDLENASLVEAFSQLAGKPRKNNKRRDEYAGGDIRQEFGLKRAPARRLVSHQNDQQILEQIVVEGAARLGAKKRQETPLAHQSKLIGVFHTVAKSARMQPIPAVDEQTVSH